MVFSLSGPARPNRYPRPVPLLSPKAGQAGYAPESAAFAQKFPDEVWEYHYLRDRVGAAAQPQAPAAPAAQVTDT